MLEKLTLADFSPLLDQTFALTDTGLTLRLAEAAALRNSGRGREPFSLIFHGPAHAPLEQKIHPMEHPALARLELFLVPIGYIDTPEGRSLRYQAVFA